ncbi:MAG TPA: hypothetical protein VLH10_02070 [Yinghuangia sp.]|uniref:hypothetical protein n=1 Tax=Yinghuangia sp. YIM S10712 TaxID=3436930 RepID=UPI002C1A9FB3|nr:hypothetical protein [Yinghuangia sp.]
MNTVATSREPSRKPSEATAKAARTTAKSRQFPRGVRRAVNSSHVVVAVGLVGVEWVMVMLGVIARNSDDPALRHNVYEVMRSLVFAAGIPLAALSLVTGVVLSLRTPWGLWKHLWIKVKIVLLILVIVLGAGVVSSWVRELGAMTAPGGDPSGLTAVQWYQIAGASVQLAALIAATFLSVYKPSGKRRPAGRR